MPDIQLLYKRLVLRVVHECLWNDCVLFFLLASKWTHPDFSILCSLLIHMMRCSKVSTMIFCINKKCAIIILLKNWRISLCVRGIRFKKSKNIGKSIYLGYLIKHQFTTFGFF